jgi:hypothetical protein
LRIAVLAGNPLINTLRPDTPLPNRSKEKRMSPQHELGRQVLNVPMQDDDSGATTVRGYLVALAAAVWGEGEEFSGKRPFGNSGWHWDVYAALVKAGLLDGTFDEYGGLDADPEKGDELIAAALKALAEPDAQGDA